MRTWLIRSFPFLGRWVEIVPATFCCVECFVAGVLVAIAGIWKRKKP